MEDKRVLIIVPAYNESGSITKTLVDIKNFNPQAETVVVDDGSTDSTRMEVINAGGKVISLPFNLGIGGAVQTGFKYAAKNDFDIAVQIDGDGQHDAEYLSKLIAPVAAGEVDMSIGSRFIEPFVGYRSSFVRRIGINFFAWLISALTGAKVSDPTSGFRAYNKKAIKVFAENYPQDFPEPEAIMTAKRMGLSLKEVPVKMRKRLAGHSSIRYLNTLYYMFKVTFAILLNTLKRKV